MLKDQVKPFPSRLYLLYHELRRDPSQYSYSVDTQTFEKHVDLFARLQKGEGSGLRPEITPELTFDDGHISNVELAAPILQSRNLTARFFITVGWTGIKPGYMGWPELRSLHGAGHGIGAHGWTHTLLTHCTEQDLETELNGARLTLEDKLGTAITTMSLPGGRYNRRVLRACEEAGYTEVYTSIPRVEVEPIGPHVGRLNIRREMTLDWISSLFQPASNVVAGLGRQYKLKAAAKTVLGDRLYEKLWALLNRDSAAGGDGAAGGDSAG